LRAALFVSSLAILTTAQVAPGVPVPVSVENYKTLLTTTPATIVFFHDANNAKNEVEMHREVTEAA